MIRDIPSSLSQKLTVFHRVHGKKIIFHLLFALVMIAPSLHASAPDLDLDHSQTEIPCPQGGTDSAKVLIKNVGDVALSWWTPEAWDVKVIKGFKIGKGVLSLKYDAGRDCFCGAYSSKSIYKISATDGKVLETKILGTAFANAAGIEMEGTYVWVADSKYPPPSRFVKVDLSNMAELLSFNCPTAWSSVTGLARGDGKMFPGPIYDPGFFRPNLHFRCLLFRNGRAMLDLDLPTSERAI